jgi:tRNA (guanine9-N1)-methyltransferase
MENLNYLCEVDVLFPEYQEEMEESLKLKQNEKNKRKEEYLKNHIKKENIPNKISKKEKKRQKRKNIQEKIKMKNYQAVKDMTKEEKEKYYNEYYNEKILLKEKEKDKLLQAYNSNFIICFDLNYNSYMDYKEQKSLVAQLSLCYSINKHNIKKINFYFTNVGEDLREKLNKNGAEKWKVHYYDIPFYSINELIKLNKEFVYLTPDAKEDLEDVNEDKIYIIGGIVDRSVIKNLSMNRVSNIQNENNNNIKITTKKLPLLKYIKDLKNIVLNINTVVEILSFYIDMDKDKKDWKNVLERALPKRKFDNKI